jgi:hypothetical protein
LYVRFSQVAHLVISRCYATQFVFAGREFYIFNNLLHAEQYRKCDNNITVVAFGVFTTHSHTHSVIARIYTIVGIVNGQGIILLLRSTGMLMTAETREKPTSHQIFFFARHHYRRDYYDALKYGSLFDSAFPHHRLGTV